jgi:hypothetical protein
MSFFAYSLGFFNAHRSATPVDIGSSPATSVGRRSMRPEGSTLEVRVAGRFVVSARVRVLSGAQPSVAAPSHQAFVRASSRHAPAQAQPVDVSPIEHLAIANAYQRSVTYGLCILMAKTVFSSRKCANLALQPRSLRSLDPAR